MTSTREKRGLNELRQRLKSATPGLAQSQSAAASCGCPHADASERSSRVCAHCGERGHRYDECAHLKRAQTALDERAQRTPRAEPFAQRFEAAFDALDRAAGGHNYVTLGLLRAALPDVARATFDAELNALRRARRFTLDPSDGRHVQMTAAEREAGIREGNNLLVYVARRTDRDPISRMDEDLPRFARRVLEAARSSPTGRFGDNKVFISHVHRRLGATAPNLGTFKARLIEAHRAGLVTLSRADLVEAMSPADVQASEANYLGEQFHFVRLNQEKPRW